MNKQQITALGNPCEFAEQCADQKYRTVSQTGRYYVSVVLTVNVRQE